MLAGHGLRPVRFLLEIHHLAGCIHFHHAESGSLVQRQFEAADSDFRTATRMVGQHAAVIHLVDMVPGQDQHVGRLVQLDEINVLEHRVRRAGVPRGIFQTLLRRQQFDKLTEFAAQETSAPLKVSD